jgi:3-hydroxyisobutyrate dehydrogenase
MTTPRASTTSIDPPTAVGFIGLGDQGAPMAERLAGAGFRLHVWARRPATLERFQALGAEICAEVTELAAACPVVALCVTTDADVTEVAIDRGLIDHMEPGSVLVVHSTVAPATCIRLAEIGTARGISILDAPVSGGRAGAERGTLSVMVGGDATALASVERVLDSYASNVRHIGAVGSAQAAKLINNGLFVANVAMAACAVELGERCGIAGEQLVEVLSKSSGASAGLGALVPLTTTDWGAHAWSVLAKDVALLAEISADGADGRRLIDVAEAAIQRFGRT